MLQHLLKHSIIHAAGRVLGLVIGLVSMGLLARYLGQEQFGWYIIAFTWLQFFSIAVDFGLYMIGLKLLGEASSEKQEQQVYAQLFWLRLFSAIVFVLVLPNLVWLLPYTIGIKLGVTILAFSFFFANINQLLVVSYQRLVRMQVVAVAEVLGKILALVGLYAVIVFDWGYAAALASIVLFGVVQAAVLLVRLSSRHFISWQWDRQLIKIILKQAAPLGVIIIFNTIYFKADTLILSWFVPAEAVGLYGAPYKILEILVSFPVMYLGLLLPHVSKWWQQQKLDTLRAYAQQSLVLLSLIVFAMVPLTLVFADQIMTLVAGNEFVASGRWLRFLILAAASIFYGQLFGYLLVGIGKQKVQMYIYICIAVLALMLYGVFIPLVGVVGAAVITIVIEITATIALGAQVIKRIGWRLQLKPVLLLSIIAMCTFGIAWYASLLMPWLFAFVLGLIIYAGLVLLFRIVTIKQLQHIWKTTS